MHFFTTLATAILLTTGRSARGSPHVMPVPVAVAVADPVAVPDHPLYALQPFASRSLHGSGRRLSRKARRHADHHQHHHHSQQQGTATLTMYTTISSDIPAASETTLTQYTTITSGGVPNATDTDGNSDVPSSTDSSPQPTSTGNSGVIVAHSDQCGNPNGTVQPSQTGGPNGDENWLNCGVDGDGWVPPPVTLDNLIYQDLATVLQQDGNPFSKCSQYLPMFQNMSDETQIPTIFLASIALQESGCNADVTGGAGEIGLMQITGEKCPSDGSDCFAPMTNIRIGAQYFKTVLDTNNGNLAATMGEYNGWYPGLTTALANNYATCAQHNNLDYLQNVFNGFLQGVDPSTLNMGIYHNTC